MDIDLSDSGRTRKMNKIVLASSTKDSSLQGGRFTADPYVRAAEFYDLLAGPFLSL